MPFKRAPKLRHSPEGVRPYRQDYEAVNIIYKSLQNDREQADISDLMRQLQQVVDEAIETKPDHAVTEQNAPLYKKAAS